MKKITLIVFIALLFTMCKSHKTATSGTSEAKVEKPAEVQYRDDFRAATDKERTKVLKGLKATAAKYSVVILTQNYKGEKITLGNAKGQFYSGYAISNLKTGIADKTRIDNTVDTTLYDKSDNHEVVIEAKEAQKYKFIYVMKNPGSKTPFTVTYSNTLRPLE
ncbi:hypothetical protein HYN59_06435 [Flavobacterium album]|uniref:DUF4251 domain-containing protein n=1 Tax=Flavobacterium album TaxID=2175091 RepID=A0A2S1QWM4_9FLAO|nr:hypothetical protein [Flavobacterium album]AWH84783.1 hypothetical protein HYN59_06435 [Flavobacterium album]